MLLLVPGSKEVCSHALLPRRPGGKGLTVLSQQCGQQLVEGMEAQQEILESCHIEPEIHNSVRAEHEGKKGLRPSEAFVLSTSLAS